MAMKDTLSSPFGLDSARPTLVLSDVRAQPSKKDDGYATLATEGDLPDTTAIIQTLMLHRDLIMNNQMIYLIVENRMPADVPHWPAFAAWWVSRRCLAGPQEEATDILWVCADATTGQLRCVDLTWCSLVGRSFFPSRILFFHEYGRRVGMVPRSSLKGGKNSLMVEKRTRRPNTTQTKQPKAHRPSLHHHVVFPLC